MKTPSIRAMGFVSAHGFMEKGIRLTCSRPEYEDLVPHFVQGGMKESDWFRLHLLVILPLLCFGLVQWRVFRRSFLIV